MSNKHQIGYSLSLWETFKEYNEETKWFEPIKNKKVEVAQMLSDELSDDEEVKSLLIDKLFGYKDDIKDMIMKSDYCEIPSYHKESLEKDQKISDLEAKLAESEKSEETYKSMFEIGVENNHSLLKEIEQLKQQLAEKEEELKGKETLNQIFKDNQENKISFAVEQLEKVKNRIESKVESVYKRLDDLNIKIVCESTSRQLSTYEEIVKEIDNQIKAIKGEK